MLLSFIILHNPIRTLIEQVFDAVVNINEAPDNERAGMWADFIVDNAEI